LSALKGSSKTKKSEEQSIPVEAGVSIENSTIEQNTIENITTDKVTKKLKVHPGTVRVVREELLAELNGRDSAEIYISKIVPRTEYSRKTVDVACQQLELDGEFRFERIYPRGMKVTRIVKGN
jgi:hypothetical protein